jgi:predicted enzyme related to lactoylglutathione lyase
MFGAMFQKVDCVRLRVPDLEEGLRFYRDQLGHELAWRRGSAEAGLRMPQSDTELVLFTEPAGAAGGSPEVDLLVDSADIAVGHLRELGGRVVNEPFDIPVGRCAVVADPFGNQMVILDLSKGLLKTDADGNVLG